MPTIALNYSKSLFNTLLICIKKTLQGMMIGWMVARQTQANQYVARQLISHGEYRQEEYWNLVAKLNRDCIQRIHKEFS